MVTIIMVINFSNEKMFHYLMNHEIKLTTAFHFYPFAKIIMVNGRYVFEYYRFIEAIKRAIIWYMVCMAKFTSIKFHFEAVNQCYGP